MSIKRNANNPTTLEALRQTTDLASNLATASHPAPPPLEVSVIIPCYNSARTIRQCLQAVFAQRTDIAFDVTVVDSSTDETPQIVAREFPLARLIRCERRTWAGTARNLGVAATAAPFCLMLDSDCIAAPDWLEGVMARHREGEYAAVGGALKNGTPRSLSGLVGYLIEFKEFMPSAPQRFERSIPTANLAYRRTALVACGGFDDEMEFAEDILLNWQLYNRGERLLFAPEIAVTHLNRTGWRRVLFYQVGLGRLSAKARRRGALPGNFLLRYPALIALLPLARTLRAFQWFARHDRKMLLIFLFIWPLYLLAAAFWAYGFFQGARQ